MTYSQRMLDAFICGYCHAKEVPVSHEFSHEETLAMVKAWLNEPIIQGHVPNEIERERAAKEFLDEDVADLEKPN